MPVRIEDFLPPHLKHWKHSKLFKSLEMTLSQFDGMLENRQITILIKKIISIELLKIFENTKFEIPPGFGIENYRYNSTYWEIVVPKATVRLNDNSTGKTRFFDSGVDVAIEGSGGSIRKGKRKVESIKRASSRQTAQDLKKKRREEEGETDSEEEEEWDSDDFIDDSD